MWKNVDLAILNKMKEKPLDLPPDPDLHQNWLASSLTQTKSFHQVSWKSVQLLLCCSQTNQEINRRVNTKGNETAFLPVIIPHDYSFYASDGEQIHSWCFMQKCLQCIENIKSSFESTEKVSGLCLSPSLQDRISRSIICHIK